MISSARAKVCRRTVQWCSSLLLLAAGPPLAAQWVAEGPGPNTQGQVEGIVDGEVVGAVNAVAPHPSSAGTIYVGGANGGIWKTTNATAASPSWTHQTDDKTSLSIGALEFDPTDVSNQTLLAGIGQFSSFGRIGGALTGLLRTTDGGATWTEIDGGMAGRNIIGVAPRGSTLVAAVDTLAAFDCTQLGIWRSTDTGASWSQITNGIPRGRADVLASDPSDEDTLYTSIVSGDVCDGGANGIYKSVDNGASWSKVSTGAMDALLVSSSGTSVEIAVGQSSNVFVAIAPSSTGRLGGVFRSGNGGTSWTEMDLPTTFEDTADVGIHPGGQASVHFSLAADPTDVDIVYIGGDRQPLSFNDGGGFPNSIGAIDFSGRLFRGDAGTQPGSQWTPLTHSGTGSNSSPHADSRDMAFDAGGNLIEGDDGGIYKRVSPRSGAGDWVTINGDLQTAELHDASYDSVSDIVIGGAQDTGTPQQVVPGGLTWESVSTADGGDVAVDSTSTPGMSVRYSSFQNLGAFRRRTYDAANVLQSQAFPARTVVSGAPLAVQFVTPVVTNAVDGSRLIIGGANSVYESLDQGDTLSEIGVGIFTLSFGRNTIAYGADGNANVLYVGGCVGASCFSDGDDGVYVRSGAGALSAVPTLVPAAGQVIQGVTVDPDDPAHAFAIDSSNVYRTSNTGSSWSNVTGDLPTTDTGTLRSIEFVNGPSGDLVVVGTDRGVYAAAATAGFSAWAQLGTDLPNAPVFELDYGSAADKLVAGMLGRGAFSLQPTSVGVPSIFADGFESGNTTAWSATVP